MTNSPAMTPQQREFSDVKKSGLSAYRRLVVGERSLFTFIFFELSQLISSNVPGILGLALRALLLPRLLRRCGKRPAVGRGVVFRIPHQMEFGDGVLIDDFAAIDIRGEASSIIIGDRVSIGRFSTVAAKGGSIELQSGVNVGSYCRIATNSRVVIGESVLIGAYCYVGPGNHTEGESGKPLIEQPMDIKGGVEIGCHAWLGTGVTVLDGVRIGRHAIIGAHSLVTSDVPDWGVAVGTPAKVIKVRNQ
jgi:acetyltransferase-like isoleucine patch superfamily enzyme